MGLASGNYTAKVSKTVTVWPAPDADGDGPEVWLDNKDHDGNFIGRTQLRDGSGKVVKEYLPPAGFVNLPSYDHTDNYVRVDERGQVVRDKNGRALNIKPGQALVEHDDGTVEVLDDEYAQYLFSNGHMLTPVKAPVKAAAVKGDK